MTLCCAFAGPIIATFLALAVGLGALISTSLAVMSFVWVIPAAAVLLSLGGLFVFPAVLTLVSSCSPNIGKSSLPYVCNMPSMQIGLLAIWSI